MKKLKLNKNIDIMDITKVGEYNETLMMWLEIQRRKNKHF